MPDRLVFKLSNNGDFSTKLYCEKIRTKGIRRGWASRVWQNNLIPKSASLLWKLMRHAVSVDNRVQTRGIPFVSRCRCCAECDIETITHLFIKSETAKAIWTCFGSIFRLPHNFQSLAHALYTWMPEKGNLSQFEFCRANVFAIVCWEIWVTRCATNFDGTPIRARVICQRVIGQVQMLSVSFSPRKPSSIFQSQMLGIMGIRPSARPLKPGRWVKWEAPSQGRFKLNIDGSAIDSSFACGGIIRDSKGCLVAAFSNFYGQGTNTLAEFLALRDGLDLCKTMGLEDVIVESDSQVVVAAIHSRHNNHWKLQYVLR